MKECKIRFNPEGRKIFNDNARRLLPLKEARAGHAWNNFDRYQEQEAEESKDEKKPKREDESKNGKQCGPEVSEVEGSECADSIEICFRGRS